MPIPNDAHPLLRGALKDVLDKQEKDVKGLGIPRAEEPTAIAARVAANVPDVVYLQGYGLGLVASSGGPWYLLYLDEHLQSWLLIRQADIKGYSRNDVLSEYLPQVPDDVWVARDAIVFAGRGAHDVELMFLQGTATRASDLPQTLGSRGGRGPGPLPSPPFCNCGSRTRG